jgi:hypothetical protein
MTVSGYSAAVGTAVVPVVGMSADAQYVVLQNVEPESTVPALSRAGRVYLVEQEFTVTGAGTALFNVATGPTGFQIEFYEIVSDRGTILAELIEGATVTTTGSAIPAYNMNREFPDDYDAVFTAASTVTGGSAISRELLPASVAGGAGQMSISKIHTLLADSDYAMRFINRSEQTTTCFLQIGFTEKFNGQDDLWLGGAEGEGFRLRGGESVALPMIAGQTLSAVATEAATLGVLKQD